MLTNIYLNLILSKIDTDLDTNKGGCCYIAHLLAKELERMNDCFWLVIQASSYKGNHYCIYSEKFGYLNGFSEYDNQVQFKSSSKTILKIYQENVWSEKYDSANNDKVRDIIEKLFKTIEK